ncbi:hypothetical protein Bca4012_030965 [Brassica carinata]|uniref:Uncharacterized protein n=1 Tax=Brassica carinata TaxID=52824 RepID=A0A8X7URK4_BRACI|nr:hypothetical protein Bca52824_047771 [Brassica carinata]
MTIKSTSLAICLLFSLATIATAYYSPSSPPVHQSQGYKPTLPPPVYIPKPILPPPVYTPPTKPYVPKPTYTPPTKPYVPKPTYTPPTKPYVPKPTYTPPTKPYVPKPTYTPPTKPYVPKPTYTPPTKPYVPEILKVVDGIILCKNGYETYPIQGAKAKIVCSEPGSYGKKDVVIYSDPTYSKGYFHVALTDIVKNLLHCRVKLYTSPVETCKNPTNVNKGLTGVPLSMYGYRYHADKNLKIFSVGPFYFTGHKSAPTTPKY